MRIEQISVAQDGTHHEFECRPIYGARFTQVQKFHPPGFAAVRDYSGSYHITVEGTPAYASRFLGSFGFYHDRAAVHDEFGWFHISSSGEAVYPERYAWCGNYQAGFVPVRDGAGNYFHLDLNGRRTYAEMYLYVGDYRDGIACARRSDGQCVHIDRQGKLVHGNSFLEIDVFHKGFARARDSRGWFHIRVDGSAACAGD